MKGNLQKAVLMLFPSNVHVRPLRVLMPRENIIHSLMRRNSFVSRPQAWTHHLLSAHVSDEDLNATAGLNMSSIHGKAHDIANSLEGLDVDHLGALAVSVERFDS